MVKSKKTATKKAKNEEPTEVEVLTENSTDAKDEETENVSQENGEVDSTLKKKGKGKSAKKEDATSDDDANEDDEPETQENGSGDATDKKKPAAKKAKPSKKTETKSVSEPSRKSSRTPKPVAKEGTEEESYEVEKLIDFRTVRGKKQYLVRWKGYTKDDDTWEEGSSLNCPDLLQKFKEDHPDTGKKAKKRPAAKSSAKSPKAAKKEEKDYEVEEIVGMRVKNGKKEFKIRWKGYKPSDDSWEPEKHLSCQDLIEKYLETHKEEEEEEEEEEKVEKKTPAKKEKATTKSGRKVRAK